MTKNGGGIDAAEAGVGRPLCYGVSVNGIKNLHFNIIPQMFAFSSNVRCVLAGLVLGSASTFIFEGTLSTSTYELKKS